MKKLAVASVFMGLFAFVITPAFASPAGLWSRTNDQGETKIEIAPAGDKFTGTIAWMENPRNDIHNPDDVLRGRSLIGVQIFNDMQQITETRWEGSLYNPEDGKIYEGSLEVVDVNTLKLEGCVRIIIFPICRDDTWTRTTLAISN